MPNSTINATTNGLNSTAGNVATLDLQVGNSTVASITGSGMSVTGTLSATTFVGAGFAAGTVMLFAQTAAPTGWTKNTSTGDNSALRVVTGAASTGGSVAFTTAFASQTPTITISAITGSAGATTLTTPQIPSHTHPNGYTATGGTSTSPGANLGPQTQTGAAGGGGSHTHPFSFSSGTATSSAINLAVQYIDVIRATKD